LGERLVEVSFLIPEIRDSDRRLHQPIAWRLLQDEIRRRFPQGHSGPENFHRAVDLVPGEYSEGPDDPPVNDRSRRYILSLPETRVDEMKELLRKAAVTFDQRAMYLSVAGVVEFVTRGDEGLV
jgi:hypothetical protein